MPGRWSEPVPQPASICSALGLVAPRHRGALFGIAGGRETWLSAGSTDETAAPPHAKMASTRCVSTHSSIDGKVAPKRADEPGTRPGTGRRVPNGIGQDSRNRCTAQHGSDGSWRWAVYTYFFLNCFRTDGRPHGVTVTALPVHRWKSGCHPIPANRARRRGAGMGIVGIEQRRDPRPVPSPDSWIARPIERTEPL